MQAKKASKPKGEKRERADVVCPLCGIRGTEPNEFSSLSKYTGSQYVVFAKGDDDYPAGNCMKCECVWLKGGWALEYGTPDKFLAEREKDPELGHIWKESCKVWLEAALQQPRIRFVFLKLLGRSSTSRGLSLNLFSFYLQVARLSPRLLRESSHGHCLRLDTSRHLSLDF